MNYEFAKLLDGTRWLMEKKAFRAMIKRAESATPDAIRAAVAAYGQSQGPKMYGDVAVIDACGPITYRSSWFSMYFGGSSIEDLQMKLRTAMADPAVKTIVFRWDSPGGCVEMVPEFADEVYAMRGAMSSKPIISVADTMCCSAAYWIASQSDSIYATTSSRMGAVGVFVEHDDISGMLEKAGIKVTLIAHGAHKVDGNPFEALGDAVKAEIQDDVDQIGDLFDAAVARGRGVTTQVVLDTFGQGDVFNGREALKIGLADKKSTFAALLAKLTKGRASVSTSMSGLTLGLDRANGPDSASIVELHVHAGRQLFDALVKSVPKADQDEAPSTVEPEDGECPDGYELGEDGLCHLIDPADDDENDAKADHTDVGRDEGGKFSAQCACHADCVCMTGDGICGSGCMTCEPGCACLTKSLADTDQAAILAALSGDN